MNRCFVISPIGHPESQTRAHADDVLNLIIRPAAKELKLEAIRSDEINDEGRISQQMFHEILGSQLVIGVLTESNANVLYEVAIAQCARRPLVLLIREGDDLPFDVKDLRIILYDGNFHAGKLRKVIDLIVERATRQLRDAEHVPTPSDLFGCWPAPPAQPLQIGCAFDECVEEIRRELKADGIFSIWSWEDSHSIPDFEYIRNIALQKLLFVSTKIWHGRAQSANLWICHDVDSQDRPRNLRSGMRNGYFPFDQLLSKVPVARKVYYRSLVVDYEREDLSVAAQVVRSNKPLIERVRDSKFNDDPEEALGIQWILGIPTTHACLPAKPGQPLCITVDYLDPIDDGSFEKVRQRASTVSGLLTKLLAVHTSDS